jgi:hypothetical protein
LDSEKWTRQPGQDITWTKQTWTTQQATGIPCWRVSRVGLITAGWPLRGGRGKKNTKIQKFILKLREVFKLNKISQTSE